MAAHPETDVFLLDDGMQHRRAARDLEVVLVGAVEPFGFGRVLPRGLLREPLAGLRRADVFVVTHAAEVPPDQLEAVEATLRRYNASAPVHLADHTLTGFLPKEGAPLPPSALSDTRYFAACGVGQPNSFLAGLNAISPTCVGHRFFPDHHPFSDADVSSLRDRTAKAGAAVVVVTEKDWVKLVRLPQTRSPGIPIWTATLGIRFWEDGEQRLLGLVESRLNDLPVGR